MKLYIMLFVLLSAGVSYAQTKCTALIYTRPGDLVETRTNWWDQADGASSFNFTISINGVQWQGYPGATFLGSSEGNRCVHDCLHISFMATTYEVYVENYVTSGNANGWKCSQDTWVVGHIVPPSIKQRKKQVAAAVKSYLSEANDFLIPASFTTCVAAKFFPGLVLPCIGLGASSTGAGLIGGWMSLVDPWDDNFYLPYDGNWQYAEDQVAQQVQYTGDPDVDAIIISTTYVIYYLEFVKVSMDRASSCELAGWDCGSWQRDRVEYGLYQAGAWLNEIAYRNWVLAWRIEQDGGDGNDGNAVAKLRDMANWYSWTASEFQAQ